jgi:hypothetical protein
MHLTKAEAKKITGVEPRKVHYCLWNDGTKDGTRNACSYYHVIECENDEQAKREATNYYKAGRESYHNKTTLYSHLQWEYYQREGDFVPTVFTYTNDKGWSYGYFITRWNLDYKSRIRDIAGKLNCNFYASVKLDSEEPANRDWLTQEVGQIFSKYKPK